MTRSLVLAACGLAFAALGSPAVSQDEPKKVSPDERKELEAKSHALNDAGIRAHRAGKVAEAARLFADALAVDRRLYPPDEYPDGHQNLALSLVNLAALYQALGRYADAEPLYRDGLAMTRRLNRGDHPDVARTLNNLAAFYEDLGRFGDAEPLYRDALDMYRRLHKGDHPDLAAALNNLGHLYLARGKAADAEPLYRQALDMRKRLFKGDHPYVAESLNNLAYLYDSGRKFDEAEPLYRAALDMRKRLFEGDHPDVADGLHNLAGVYESQGKYAAAEPLVRAALDMNRRLFPGDNGAVARGLNNLAALLKGEGKYADAGPFYRDALEMYRRLYKGDHLEVAACLGNLAGLYEDEGRHADAAPLLRDALAMHRRLVARYAGRLSEGDALTLSASLPQLRDAVLSNALAGKFDPPTVYPDVWASKGAIARVFERRHQAARATADPAVTKVQSDLTAARRRRAELILTPPGNDPAAREKRAADLRRLDEEVATLDRALRPLLPAVERADRLAAATPAALQAALSTDAAVVDYLRYTLFEQDRDKPGRAGEKRTDRYLAFVVTWDRIVRVELGEAAKVEMAVAAWRAAVAGGREVPAAVSAAVRGLVWERVRAELPPRVKTVYVSPDVALCRVPFAALPGDKPGTVLLEDYAVATISHAPFLLDKLWPQDPVKNPPAGVLVVGGVAYDAHPPPAVPVPAGDLPGSRVGWPALPGTAAEAAGVATAAVASKFAATTFSGDRATAAVILAALPKVRVAHLATHGFFAGREFRSVFQFDEKDYEQSRFGERIGRARISPLVMTGLAFAGANDPQAAGRGIVTGESLVDLDLSGLELAVLSACETGLGDMAGGEGTFGLQRAFHLAGTCDVVASLWKVPDQSTAALMALFYRNLWEKGLPPVEALRQAQLEVYRNPVAISALAAGFRGEFKVVPGAAGVTEVKRDAGGKTHPLHWAAFTLSGPGR